MKLALTLLLLGAATYVQGASIYSKRDANGLSHTLQRRQDNEVEATGGIGGTDPATGEELQPLPEVSQFCQGTGQEPSNGTQKKQGSCSSLPQGQIPNENKMVSTIILEPKFGDTIGTNAAFDVRLKTINLETGFFTVAATEYYTQPQTLNGAGEIRGHQHVTIQNLGDENNPPEPTAKDFFKGVDERAENGENVVNVPADTLRTPGTYRICTLSSSFSHQPVVMPVAQRGAQDDCIRITIADGAGGGAGQGDQGGDAGQEGEQGGEGQEGQQGGEGQGGQQGGGGQEGQQGGEGQEGQQGGEGQEGQQGGEGQGGQQGGEGQGGQQGGGGQEGQQGGEGGGGGGGGENLQKSTSALGGIPPPPVINDGSDRPFKVNGDSFLNVGAALGRSCDVQANACQDKFNSGDRGDLQQGDCDRQRNECNAANAA